ncbi:PQQ-dependent catabolism-associated CXXCW motif protein [Poseidonocella pacifica]|uniref:PQQ-dependent catabolism-associated CXXCW motif protein n=1 Tax=Poseidonocella pacifica TaxID=871651 RepID=A0A1I0YG99_9RHOB|nr:PQQ-dependent catabolism-associated CXXCW motif protein [Poseidonocella pacifica]SFB12445.1 PQQ-dependent catabolism-associated CXXCW motif protein [Poseidonocella pacifica]
MIRAVAAAFAFLATVASAQAPEPDSYRMDEYRAPVPETLAGATVLTPTEAHDLWTSGAAFVDVLPRAPKPANLPEGTIWREKPRHSIPGSVWLPNVGYGAIALETDAYFRSGLEAATKGDRDAPLVLFCLDECWMSWNAAKRALEYGYTSVYWLPEGTDGWSFEDYPTEVIEPAPPVD